MFSYICCNLLSLFFVYLSDLKKRSRQKKGIKRSVIFIAGTDQYGVLISIRLLTTRGIATQLFLKILKLVFIKKCVYVKLTEVNHSFFGYKRFCQSKKNESFRKQKRVSPLRSIPKVYTFRRHLAQYPDANFQIKFYSSL